MSYKDPRWLAPLEILIAVIGAVTMLVVLAVMVMIAVIGWIFGVPLFLDYRGNTYRVRWFSARLAETRE